MDMLEDYLRAVSRLLPRTKREDIIAELRDEILTRIEARESELNRSLTEDETERLLREFGHPIVVAGRYRDGTQYSVGPALYPYWFFAVRLAIVLEICVSVIVFIARGFGTGNFAEAFGSAIGSGLTGAMTLIGFATVAAWLIERQSIKINYFDTWRVRDLRFLDFALWDWTDFSEWIKTMNTTYQTTDKTTPRHEYRYYGWSTRQSSASRGVGAIVFGTVFILWWIGVISFGLTPMTVNFSWVNVDPGALAHIDLAAFKSALYWPVLAYFCGLIAFGALVLTFPRGVRLRGAVDMAIGLSVLALAVWIWTASPIAEIVRVDSAAQLAEKVKALVEHPVPLSLETVVTLFLIFTAFGGFCRTLGGLWEVLTGAPRYPSDG